MRDILSDAEKQNASGERNPDVLNAGLDRPKLPKRFYRQVTVQEREPERFSILLDGKPVRTPGKNLFAMQNEAIAQLIAKEWDAQKEEINPLLMPCTRIANTAIDGVAEEAQAVAEDILKYASSDLLCYRADTPEGLVRNQRDHWDPVLDWAQESFDAAFEVGTGIVHVTQPKSAIYAFGYRLKEFQSPLELAALHTLTSLSGSALLALAVAEARLSAEQAWTAAHVDEDWNISLWGEDYEAAQTRQQRWREFNAASTLLQAAKQH